eukprot:43883_1
MRKFIDEIDIAETVLVLIDPDMIITKIFNFKIEKGHPVSQKYGIGAKWIEWNLCKTEACKSVNDRDAWNHYSVGPPYMMHIDDWRLIVNEWVEYSPDALNMILHHQY